MKTQLLCTFTTKKELDSIIELIKDSYDISFKKIYPRITPNIGIKYATCA